MKCKSCGQVKETVQKRRQSSNFDSDELNYTVYCLECFEEEELFWNEMQWKLYGDLHYNERF